MKHKEVLTDEMIESTLQEWGARVRSRMQEQYNAHVHLSAAGEPRLRLWIDPIGGRMELRLEEHSHTATLIIRATGESRQRKKRLLRIRWQDEESGLNYELFLITDRQGDAEIPQLPARLLTAKLHPQVVEIIISNGTDIEALVKALQKAQRLPRQEALCQWFRKHRATQVCERLASVYNGRTY